MTKHNSSNDLQFPQAEILIGAERSTGALFAILN